MLGAKDAFTSIARKFFSVQISSEVPQSRKVGKSQCWGVFSMSEIVSSEKGESTVIRDNIAVQAQVTSIDWQQIASSSDFRELIREKRNFILPATIFFLVYYFGFLVFVGYFPTIAEMNVIGNINIAYLSAISEFVMTWVLVFLYVRRAGLFDRLAQAIFNKVKGVSA
jgi:uncharacterized membrane protein (DUF485 family)